MRRSTVLSLSPHVVFPGNHYVSLPMVFFGSTVVELKPHNCEIEGLNLVVGNGGEKIEEKNNDQAR
jgi:hypothetical protein